LCARLLTIAMGESMMTEETADSVFLRKAAPDFAWEGIARLPYKEAELAPFKAISRQTLFSDSRLSGELRYFEIDPGGFSTLERHAHMHGVMILRGGGRCLIGGAVHALSPRDLVTIEPWTWHQFRAGRQEPLGFLCLVNSERDKPQLPNFEDLAVLRENPAVARFLDGG
jgi:quercetin dioxygenase-like cupin family protein